MCEKYLHFLKLSDQLTQKRAKKIEKRRQTCESITVAFAECRTFSSAWIIIIKCAWLAYAYICVTKGALDESSNWNVPRSTALALHFLANRNKNKPLLWPSAHISLCPSRVWNKLRILYPWGVYSGVYYNNVSSLFGSVDPKHVRLYGTSLLESTSIRWCAMWLNELLTLQHTHTHTHTITHSCTMSIAFAPALQSDTVPWHVLIWFIAVAVNGKIYSFCAFVKCSADCRWTIDSNCYKITADLWAEVNRPNIASRRFPTKSNYNSNELAQRFDRLPPKTAIAANSRKW